MEKTEILNENEEIKGYDTFQEQGEDKTLIRANLNQNKPPQKSSNKPLFYVLCLLS